MAEAVDVAEDAEEAEAEEEEEVEDVVGEGMVTILTVPIIGSGMNYKLYVHQGGTKQYHVPFGYTLPKQCYFLVQFDQMKNDVNS